MVVDGDCSAIQALGLHAVAEAVCSFEFEPSVPIWATGTLIHSIHTELSALRPDFADSFVDIAERRSFSQMSFFLNIFFFKYLFFHKHLFHKYLFLQIS